MLVVVVGNDPAETDEWKLVNLQSLGNDGEAQGHAWQQNRCTTGRNVQHIYFGLNFHQSLISHPLQLLLWTSNI